MKTHPFSFKKLSFTLLAACGLSFSLLAPAAASTDAGASATADKIDKKDNTAKLDKACQAPAGVTAEKLLRGDAKLEFAFLHGKNIPDGKRDYPAQFAKYIPKTLRHNYNSFKVVDNCSSFLIQDKTVKIQLPDSKMMLTVTLAKSAPNSDKFTLALQLSKNEKEPTKLKIHIKKGVFYLPIILNHSDSKGVIVVAMKLS